MKTPHYYPISDEIAIINMRHDDCRFFIGKSNITRNEIMTHYHITGCEALFSIHDSGTDNYDAYADVYVPTNVKNIIIEIDYFSEDQSIFGDGKYFLIASCWYNMKVLLEEKEMFDFKTIGSLYDFVVTEWGKECESNN